MDLMIPLRNMGVDSNLLDALHDLLDFSDEQNQASHHAPSRQYVREAKAMSATPADVKETQNAYIFVIDVPGLKSDQIKVHLEDDNVLVVCGERKREKERDKGVRYLRMERRLGKYLKKFVLPENADVEKISAECQDGVLTIVVEKKPPPELKKPKIVQVRIGDSQEGQQGQGGQWGQEGQSGGQGDQWGQKGQGGQEGQGGQDGNSR
ncbi:putative small heat shock protein HSP20 [Rosa chinensis]|uniref:Putative small heat shock protein HSP20 n=1 Tax=Rosa chinensis TaxID=74649 RepID=A0A2P6Q1E3_ROSCH|nr:17.1 kDa class II heat shock protein [Rosa chinensis]PRQ28012.1 putative small heat shock protein HSP20 [Rosa chinensis]